MQDAKNRQAAEAKARERREHAMSSGDLDRDDASSGKSSSALNFLSMSDTKAQGKIFEQEVQMSLEYLIKEMKHKVYKWEIQS